MGMLSEFKEFAVKGNVVDLAVGVIIGGAFGKIVDSMVKDLIMPLVGKVVGGLDFSNYFVALAPIPADFKGPQTYEALTKAGVPLFAYGSFLTVSLNIDFIGAGRQGRVTATGRVVGGGRVGVGAVGHSPSVGTVRGGRAPVGWGAGAGADEEC